MVTFRRITLLAALLVCLGLILPTYAQNDDSVARVNAESISRTAFYARVRFVRWEYLNELDKLYELTAGDLGLTQAFAQSRVDALQNPYTLAGDILTQMEEELLLQQAARGLNVSPTDEQVQATEMEFFSWWTGVAADQIAQDATAQGFIQNWYAQATAVSGLSEEEIHALFAAETLRGLLFDTISASVAQEELAVNSRHILCSFHPENVTDVTPPTAEQRAAAEACIQQAQDDLKAGESFAQVAAALSNDMDTAASGGELGWVPVSYLVAGYADAVSQAELNTVIGPVETEYGLHLVEVLDRRMQPISEAELDSIKQDTFQAWIDTLRAGATIERSEDWATGVPTDPGLDTLAPEVQAALEQLPMPTGQ